MPKEKASQSFINAASEFESIERILLYLKVSDVIIKEDIQKSINKLKVVNDNIEIPYILNSEKEREFLQLNSYERTLSTIMYIRTMDNFETYFKEILSEIVTKDPRILKSNEKENLEFILSFNNHQDLIKAIADKKIESLFYQGIDNIQKFFNEKIKIEIFKDKSDEINLLMKQRNLAVHNRSKISKSFVQQFPNENFIEDMYLDFDFKYLEKLIGALYKIINTIDYETSKKFDLNQIEY